ncbi:MAG: cupin domain-containing protein [Syntrophomonas sp.]|nr:cupin domain-containing protein [Syntrophomonas sp.]
MYIGHVNEIAGLEINSPGAALNVMKQVLVGPEQGWQGWVMRLFTISNDGYSPRHAHPWPHINYIVSGKGTLFLGGQDYEVQAGSVAFVPDNIEHQFKNTSTDDFIFICIVPETGDK